MLLNGSHKQHNFLCMYTNYSQETRTVLYMANRKLYLWLRDQISDNSLSIHFDRLNLELYLPHMIAFFLCKLNLTSAKYSSSCAATSMSQFFVRSRIGCNRWLYLEARSFESLLLAWDGMIRVEISPKTHPKLTQNMFSNKTNSQRVNFPPFQVTTEHARSWFIADQDYSGDIFFPLHSLSQFFLILFSVVFSVCHHISSYVSEI